MGTASRRPHGIRVTGVLVADAQLMRSAGALPRAWIDLCLQPPEGLAYHARIDLGTDCADHMQAEGLMSSLRAHALVSVAAHGTALPRTDHHRAVHQLLNPYGLILLSPPATRQPRPHPTQEPTHAH